MTAKRGDDVPPPARGAEWRIRFGNAGAVDGWDELCRHAAGNVRKAWDAMRNDPDRAQPSHRHHRLKGDLATGSFKGQDLPRWQIEVTSASCVWYLVDERAKTVWVVHAGVGHPKATE